MKTASLWYTGEKTIELREVDLPALGRHDVLVEIEVCGVCTWDLFIFAGGYQSEKAYPFYFGHEGIGRIVERGAGVTRVAVGDRVALRETEDIGARGEGHMARYAVLREDRVIPLPETQWPATRWTIEPIACCVNAVDRAAVRCGDRVALVGCGFMGNIILQGLLLTPAAEIVVIDTAESRLELARVAANGRPITTVHVDAMDVEALADRFDVVVETAAAEAGFRLADRLVRKAGRLVVFSWHHAPFLIDLGAWHRKGVTVLNVSPATHPNFVECFHQSIPLIESGKINTEFLVTHFSPPDEAQSIYRHGIAKTDGYVKGMIHWGR